MGRHRRGTGPALFRTRDPRGHARRATVICTPGLRVPDYPDGQVVTVDLEGSVTRICGTDFCGETKRAGLRMWSKRAWDLGGLPLHAAAVSAGPAAQGRPIALLVGRPGTGKSTLVLADRSRGVACQEDRVAWLRDGSLVPAESAFFSPAALAAEGSTLVRNAVGEPGSYLLNPPAGRVVFGDRDVAAVMAGERPELVILLVRNQNVLPAVARLGRDSAAAVYVASTWRGSEPEPGARTRPGANPLLPLVGSRAGRAAAGSAGTPRHRDLCDEHAAGSAALSEPAHATSNRATRRRIVAALLGGDIKWRHEPSLGCDVALRVTGLEPGDAALLRPLRALPATGPGG